MQHLNNKLSFSNPMLKNINLTEVDKHNQIIFDKALPKQVKYTRAEKVGRTSARKDHGLARKQLELMTVMFENLYNPLAVCRPKKFCQPHPLE